MDSRIIGPDNVVKLTPGFVISIMGKQIECNPYEHPNGIVSVSYTPNSRKRKERVISHKEFQKMFNKRNNIKKIRVPRKIKKHINYWMGLARPEWKLKPMPPYKRILLWNSLFDPRIIVE